MNQQELQEIVQALRAEIGRLQLDPAESERLEKLLQGAEQGGDREAAADLSLSEELARSIDRFEVEHPRFTSLLGRLASVLSAMGI